MEPLGIQPVGAADAKLVLPERRRRPRLKTHTPAYASFIGDSASVTLDLSEILDITEDGISIQAVPPLEANRQVNLCIDLSETNTYIHTTGFVVWSDGSGRAGIRLPNLPDASRQQLREWLFLNALAACAAQAAEAKAAQGIVEPPIQAATAPAPREVPIPPARDYTALLTALAAVQKEAESLGANLDAALQLIAERARAFTRASGAAIGLSSSGTGLPGSSPASLDDGKYMVCRARAGSDAPPLGAPLQVGSGFSGECVRTGRLLRCDDSEADPYVDRESCRALDIRAMVAAPIRLGGKIIGLLEVFSPTPYAFDESDSKAMQRFADTALAAVNRCRVSAGTTNPGQRPRSPLPATTKGLNDKPVIVPVVRSAQRLRGIPVHRAHLLILLAVAALIALVLGFLVAPWIDSRWNRSTERQPSAHQNVMPTPKGTTLKTVAQAGSFDDLHNLAEQGDAAAQFAVGAHYATGEDVKQNLAEAIPWFIKSAEQGNVAAQSALGAYYSVGRGVPHDVSKAYFWSILAWASGDEVSKYRIPILTAHMTQTQILAVQQEADHWLKQHQLARNSSPSR